MAGRRRDLVDHAGACGCAGGGHVSDCDSEMRSRLSRRSWVTHLHDFGVQDPDRTAPWQGSVTLSPLDEDVPTALQGGVPRRARFDRYGDRRAADCQFAERIVVRRLGDTAAGDEGEHTPPAPSPHEDGVVHYV